MKGNNIDVKFRKLSDAHSVTPPEFVWDNINEALHPKRKRRFVWFLLAAFVGMSTIGGLFMLKEKSSNKDLGVVSIEADVKKESPLETHNNIINSDETPLIIEKEQVKIQSFSDTKAKSNTSLSDLSKSVIEDRTDEATLFVNSVKENKDVVSLNTNREIFDFSKINALSLSLENDREQVRINDKISCPSFKKTIRLYPYVESNILGGLASKSFINKNNDSEIDSWIERRKNTEDPWYEWGLNATVGFNFTRNLYAGLGIEWNQAKEKFEYSEEVITKMVITFDPNSGEPIDTTIEQGYLINKGEIKYNTIDIPVTVGYTQTFNGWNVGLEMSLLYNVSLEATGRVFDQKFTLSRVENEQIYQSSIGLGWKGSLVLRKHLANGFSVQIKPTYRTYLTDVTQSIHPIGHKFRSYHVNLGVRKDF